MKNIKKLVYLIAFFMLITACQKTLVFVRSEGKPSKVDPLETEPITWVDAKKMIREHYDNSNGLKTLCESVGEKRLIGINVSAEKLRIMLRDSSLENVLLMPAVKFTHLGLSDKKQFFTMVLVGVDSNGRIDTSTALDYCDPCPSDCPENLNEMLGLENQCE